MNKLSANGRLQMWPGHLADPNGMEQGDTHNPSNHRLIANPWCFFVIYRLA